MQMSSKQVKQFQKKILDWYSENKRDLPWREVPVGTSLNQRAYRILVSEVMLQQTQVSRVIPKYEAWLGAFPTVESLASAKTSEVLRMWSGLGYNRRALYLQKAAQVIVRDYNSVWPRTVEELKKLPGIGEYTARAVACFAFDQQVAVVDTNVRKVILVEFTCHCEESPTKQSHIKGVHCTEIAASLDDSLLAMTNKQIQDIADMLLPPAKAYDWNQALMDYSSAVLKEEKIPIPRQSKFKGSRRYFRGKLIRLLLEKQTLAIHEIGMCLRDDYTKEHSDVIKGILKDLEREGFIKRNKSDISFID